MLDSSGMRTKSSSITLSAILIPAILPLLGCPQIIFGLPASMHDDPRFIAPGSVKAEPEFVPIALDFETEGHALVFRLRVDERNLEPSMGACRRWFLYRVAREAPTARRTFCENDTVRFYVEADVQHRLEFVVGSEHAVAKRVILSPGESIRWRVPVTTERFGLSINLEPGHSYTVRAREKAVNARRALGENVPRGTRWDVDEYEPVYYSGVEVGSMTISVLRDFDQRVVSELSVPLYSGRMKCEPPFCETE